MIRAVPICLAWSMAIALTLASRPCSGQQQPVQLVDAGQIDAKFDHVREQIKASTDPAAEIDEVPQHGRQTCMEKMESDQYERLVATKPKAVLNRLFWWLGLWGDGKEYKEINMLLPVCFRENWSTLGEEGKLVMKFNNAFIKERRLQNIELELTSFTLEREHESKPELGTFRMRSVGKATKNAKTRVGMDMVVIDEDAYSRYVRFQNEALASR